MTPATANGPANGAAIGPEGPAAGGPAAGGTGSGASGAAEAQPTTAPGAAAAAALVLGLLSIPLVAIAPLGVLAGAAAVTSGVVAFSKARRAGARNSQQARIGLYMGAVGLAVSGLVLGTAAMSGLSHPARLRSFNTCMSEARGVAKKQQACYTQFNRHG
ncbi:MAG: hypothetical protein ACYDH5_06050 [Acidimicrobiales bacterium]